MRYQIRSRPLGMNNTMYTSYKQPWYIWPFWLYLGKSDHLQEAERYIRYDVIRRNNLKKHGVVKTYDDKQVLLDILKNE